MGAFLMDIRRKTHRIHMQVTNSQDKVPYQEAGGYLSGSSFWGNQESPMELPANCAGSGAMWLSGTSVLSWASWVQLPVNHVSNESHCFTRQRLGSALVSLLLFCQFDTSQSYLKRGVSVKETPFLDSLSEALSGNFCLFDGWLKMDEGGPSHWVVVGRIRKSAERAVDHKVSKQCSFMASDHQVSASRSLMVACGVEV